MRGGTAAAAWDGFPAIIQTAGKTGTADFNDKNNMRLEEHLLQLMSVLHQQINQKLQLLLLYMMVVMVEM